MHPRFVEEPAGKTHKNHGLPSSQVFSFPPLATPPNQQPRLPRLAGAGSGLGRRALGALLADAPHGLALGGNGSVLGLLGLLGSLGGGLLLLALLDGLETGGGAGLGALRALLLDHVEGSTNDATLGLDGAASALLGDLL